MLSFFSYLFVGLRTPLPRLLSCVKKVGKDTQGTFWFLDLRQREGVAPSRLPQWRIELVEILRGVECKIFRLLPLTRVSSIFSFRGLVPPTLAHPFFLRRKDAKTYPRGGVLLDISSFFHESSVDKKGARDRLREGMVLARKANWFCFPSPENRIEFDFHGDGASF